jgi:hypothetical protein
MNNATRKSHRHSSLAALALMLGVAAWLGRGTLRASPSSPGATATRLGRSWNRVDPKSGTECHYRQTARHLVAFRCGDGVHGKVADGSGGALVVAHDSNGKEKVVSIVRHPDGTVSEDHDLFLGKACKTPADECRLAMYLSTLDPDEPAAEWANRLASLPPCPSRDVDPNPDGYCEGPNGDDPCPTYGRICDLPIPIIGPLFCGVKAGCAFMR